MTSLALWLIKEKRQILIYKRCTCSVASKLTWYSQIILTRFHYFVARHVLMCFDMWKIFINLQTCVSYILWQPSKWYSLLNWHKFEDNSVSVWRVHIKLMLSRFTFNLWKFVVSMAAQHSYIYVRIMTPVCAIPSECDVYGIFYNLHIILCFQFVFKFYAMLSGNYKIWYVLSSDRFRSSHKYSLLCTCLSYNFCNYLPKINNKHFTVCINLNSLFNNSWINKFKKKNNLKLWCE